MKTKTQEKEKGEVFSFYFCWVLERKTLLMGGGMGSTTVKVSNLQVPIIRGESRVPFLLLTSSSAYSFTHFALFACWKVCHSSSPVFVPSFLALLTIIQSFFFLSFFNKIIELLIFYFSIHLNLMVLICG